MGNDGSTYLYWLVIGCEVAFWVVLLLALAARYLLRRDRLSRGLLLALPCVDILLLVLSALDLRGGKPASFAHGLATAYVGFTVAFGSLVVRWADQRFAHRFAGGPAPPPSPKHGWAIVRLDVMLWLRALLAWAITIALLFSLIAFIGEDAATPELRQWFHIAFGSTILWFAFGPLWSLLFLSWRRP